MIIVSLLGMDNYEAIETTKKLHKKLVEAYNISEEELEFFAPESFIIHNGIEQTNFRLNIKVEAPREYENKEKEISAIIFDALKDIAVHLRVLFSYFERKNEYLKLDDSYPAYMTDNNTVKVDDHEEKEETQNFEEEYEEPYMGDIIEEFDNFVKANPDATNKEVYDALVGITKEVTDKHHSKDDKKGNR